MSIGAHRGSWIRTLLGVGALALLGGGCAPQLFAANINDDVPKYLNAQRPFPAWESAKSVDGSLVEADVIHRRGIFREDGSGTLRTFTMPANGVVARLGADADLRDIPLGTHGRFYLLPDQSGALVRLAALHDDSSLLIRDGVQWKVEGIDAASGTIAVFPQKDGQPAIGAVRFDLKSDQHTRFRKGEGEATVGDLVVGDLLLVDLVGDGAQRRCSEVWVGADAQTRAVEALRKTHLDFLKIRGLPAWVDGIDGKRMTVTLFAVSPAALDATLKLADINPEQWSKEGRHLHTVVANQELRSYNPPVDKEAGHLVAFKRVDNPGIGNGGQQWTLLINQFLEGFRPGEVVRIFAHGAWKIEDMPFGEGVYDHVWESPEIDPGAYPYRTDFCSDHLAWYKLQPGRLPPGCSAHERWGDLVEIAADGRSGRFRDELTGKTESFIHPPWAAVWTLGAESDLAEIPVGTRCRFALHQDANGAFTLASVIRDEFSVQKQRRLTARVLAVRADRGEVHVAWQLPKEKNYDDDWVTPPDTGWAILPIAASTKLWKGEQAIAIGDLAVGDLLQINRTGGTATTLPHCVGMWIGEDTFKSLADRQRTKHQEAVRRVGVPALVESISGRLVTMICIGADRDAFRDLLGGDPWGKQVHIQVVDDALKPRGTPMQVGFNNNIKEGPTGGCYGVAGRHWIVDCQKMPDGLAVGGYLRVFNNG
ncbi:MAG TPA: hypothetical protein VHX44_18595, partial [Planctomycetota bacterium]|nr:hypothetical protein [Planctomycetota bacterium]